jgi:predicted deacylase
MINALTHGNEVCGAILVKALLDLRIQPRRGRLTLAFANVEAYQRFDSCCPDESRYVDQDFNRVWTSTVLDDTWRDSVELRRARAMRPIFDTVDLLLDVHSMHERSAPLMLSGPLGKGIALAQAVGSPSTIICDEGHSAGRRLRDYGAFGDPKSERNALLIECGQHWERASVEVAKDSAARFLSVAGTLDEEDLPPGWLSAKAAAPRVIRVTHAVVATSMDFRFAGAYTGLEVIPKAGDIIGWSNGEPVPTPYDNCVLVMPSLRQLKPGVTVVRFGQLAAIT